MLNRKEESLLRIIVSEYIRHAQPISSQGIVRRYKLRLSSATVRNYMARLESQGYIERPHPSAGGSPTNKGYRYFVESEAQVMRLTPSEQRTIRHQFFQVGTEIRHWARLTASILSHIGRVVAIVTLPRNELSYLTRLDLISLNDSIALAVLVLKETRTHQLLVRLNEPISQETLNQVAQRLTSHYFGLGRQAISEASLFLTSMEERVTLGVLELMRAEEEGEEDEPYVHGLTELLGQPEFATSPQFRPIVEVLEERHVLNNLLHRTTPANHVQVIIGNENSADSMSHLSLILGSYGTEAGYRGALGLLGPTRMDYTRAIPAIRYLGDVMSELVETVHGPRD